MVDQPEYGTNTPYLIDFIEITLSAKLLDVEHIRSLYLEDGLSAAQIAHQWGWLGQGRRRDLAQKPGEIQGNSNRAPFLF